MFFCLCLRGCLEEILRGRLNCFLSSPPGVASLKGGYSFLSLSGIYYLCGMRVQTRNVLFETCISRFISNRNQTVDVDRKSVV